MESTMVVSIDAKRSFNSARKTTNFLVKEVLLLDAVGELLQLNDLRDWASLNAVLFSPFLTKAVVLYGQTSGVELIYIFASKISDRVLEAIAKRSYIKGEYK